jgi:dipeptidyl aminopeptidase/acylaminoacyl peptidase
MKSTTQRESKRWTGSSTGVRTVSRCWIGVPALGLALLLIAVAGCKSQQPGAAVPGAEAQAEQSLPAVPPFSPSPAVQISDLYHLSSVSSVKLSPDGTRAAFDVQKRDRPGSPYSEVWTMELAAGQLSRVGEGSTPRWSPDGRRLGYLGRVGSGQSGIVISDDKGLELVAEVRSTNHPLPQVGERFAWSPDGRHIAFVSATDGPEPPMEADPIVITRYWYRPASSWPNRFNDNRRLHIFLVDVASRQVRQLTDGLFYEHSLSWSPDGKQLAFLSNHEPDPDFFFNYDIFLMDVGSGDVRQLTRTKNNEYGPLWSPDGRTIAYQGLKRPITSSETNSEDTHVWTIDVASGARRELGAGIDNRQGRPAWSPDGRWLYFTVQSRGSVGLYRLPAGGGKEERVLPADHVRGNVGSFDVGPEGVVAFSMATPGDMPQLFMRRGEGDAQLTQLNGQVLAGKTLGEVEAFTFNTFDGRPIEAFLTKPAGLQPGGRHPMIVMIHGGPHGQQGPSFNHKAQVYAARGWAALMVNYRGSTGYGQAFSDAIARDQNGGEAKDVLRAVDEALSRYPWIDATRLGVEGGSYGGQLTNWLVTQTDRFKAAVPWASISNLVSHNYMSVYHDYLEQEYGGRPHTGGIIDMLWERSAIRLANRVKTPVMLAHGDNDMLVNPAEIEQFYIALKDVGVETIMLRYPREGHGMRETGHVADFIERSIAWYEHHFAKAEGTN